jgi:type I restriction enzyme M protein
VKHRLGALLRQVRSKLGGLSQEQLAHRLGVSWSTINRWENAKGTPSPLARQKLIDVLKEAGLDSERNALDPEA